MSLSPVSGESQQKTLGYGRPPARNQTADTDTKSLAAAGGLSISAVDPSDLAERAATGFAENPGRRTAAVIVDTTRTVRCSLRHRLQTAVTP